MSTEREITHPDEESRGSGARSEARLERRLEAGIAQTPPARGSGGGLLIGTGTVLLVLATGLLLVPSVSPAQAWIVSSLASRGATSLQLYGLGLLLCGLWLVARITRTHSLAAQQAALSTGPAIEGVADEISQLRDGLKALRIEFVYLKDAVQTQVESASTSTASDTHADAMYRLAASLDQVGQRIEEQVRSSHLEVRETLESISSSLEVSRLEGRDGRIHLGRDADRYAEPAVESHDSYGAAIPIDRGERQAPYAQDDGEPRERLGVLDLLDDLGRLLPRKTSPDLGHPVISSDAFEGVQDEGWGRPESPAGPLPAPRRKEQLDQRKAGLFANDLDQTIDDSTVATKLEELRVLLADVRVRKALTTMDRLD